MSWTEFSSFDGVALAAGGGAYTARLTIDKDAALAAETALTPRVGEFPLRESVTKQHRDLPITIIPPGGTSFAAAQEYVKGLFRLGAGLKTLQTIHSGATLQTQAEVIGHAISPGLLAVTLRAPDPTWRKTTNEAAVTASPFTVGGNAPALPVVTLTPTGTPIKRRRKTITDPGTGGYARCPIRLDIDSTGVGATSASKFRVFHQGRDVPFRVVSPNTTATGVWTVIDVPQGGSTYVDVCYGAAIDNTVTADALPAGGMDFVNSTNTSWVWNEWLVSTYPDRAGVWRPARYGVIDSANTFDLAEAAGNVLITIEPGSGYTRDNNHNAIILTLGGARAGTTNALSGLSRTLNSSGPVAFVNYRTAGAAAWSIGWSTATGGPAVTSAIDLDNAVEIIAGLVYASAAGTVYTLNLTASGTFSLALANTPTVSSAAAVDAYVIDGTLTLGGNSIVFDDVIVDGAIVITCTDPRDIAPVSGPLYGSVKPSQRSGWLPLEPGSNAFALPANTSVSIQYATAYAL